MPRKWSKKDERMYKKIVRSCRKKRGKVVCERMAAATVNKARKKRGLADTARQRRSKRRAHGVTYKTREQAERRKRYAKGKKRAAGLRGKVRGIEIERERLDRGGYTSSGRYFGVGEPLYSWWHQESGEGGHVRARNAKEARVKAEVEVARLKAREAQRSRDKEYYEESLYRRDRGWY